MSDSNCYCDSINILNRSTFIDRLYLIILLWDPSISILLLYTLENSEYLYFQETSVNFYVVMSYSPANHCPIVQSNVIRNLNPRARAAQ